MLVDVKSDRAFQQYCDQVEQRLYRDLLPVLTAGVRLQAHVSGIRAQAYVEQRGAPILLRYYRRIYRDQYRAVGASLADERADTLTAVLAEQLQWLAREAGRQIRNIAESLRRNVADLVMARVREGKSNDVIAREIARMAPEIARPRAATIARTETHNSALAAIDATLQFKNLQVRTKTWWSAQDRRVRDSHADADGQTVAHDQAFTVGGALMLRPGDSSMGAGPEEIVNCRCAVLFNLH